MAKLKPEHAELINNEWPHRNGKSLHYIKSVITLTDDGIGLFDRNTDQLLCWVFPTESFAAG